MDHLVSRPVKSLHKTHMRGKHRQSVRPRVGLSSWLGAVSSPLEPGGPGGLGLSPVRDGWREWRFEVFFVHFFLFSFLHSFPPNFCLRRHPFIHSLTHSLTHSLLLPRHACWRLPRLRFVRFVSFALALAVYSFLRRFFVSFKAAVFSVAFFGLLPRSLGFLAYSFG